MESGDAPSYTHDPEANERGKGGMSPHNHGMHCKSINAECDCTLFRTQKRESGQH